VTRPVVLIAWDGAEPSLLRLGMERGWLPALRALRARGRAYAIGGSHRDLPGAAWPNTITGTDIPQHGVYLSQQLASGTYRLDVRGTGDLGRPPFWRHVSDAGGRSVIAGVPGAPLLGEFHGVQACGWGQSDSYWTEPEPRIHPPAWKDGLERVAGTRILGLRAQPATRREVLAYRDRIVRGTRDQCAGLELLMREAEWDLFVAGFGEPHQAGKLLWHLEEPDPPGHVPDDLRGILPTLYRALDESLGRLVGAAGRDARILVLSPHGMGGKSTPGDPLGAILERGGWLARPTGARRARGAGVARALWRLGRRLTTRRIRGVLGRWLPRDRWHLSLTLANIEWSRTRAFPLVPDHLSFLRVNLAGREPEGVVPVGEMDAVIAEVSEALLELEDPGSGRPAVAEIVRPAELFGEDPDGLLPDLAVRWATLGGTRRLHSPTLGTIEVPVEGRETGMPRLPGFLIAAGPGIEPDGGDGPVGPEVSALDVAPTVLGMLGVGIPPDLAGRPIAEADAALP